MDNNRRAHLIREISNNVRAKADELREIGAFNGSHSDGGAQHMSDCLRYWEDGIVFATTGFTEVYKDIVTEVEVHLRRKERPEEYEQYLKLKKIFEV